jgi:outer membrane protein assembly factor BamB
VTRPLGLMSDLSVSLPRQSFRTMLFAVVMLAMAAGGCGHIAPPTEAVAELQAGSFTRKWIADLGLRGDDAADVYVRDDLVIIYTRENFAYVMDRESGVVKWVVQLTGKGVKVRPPVVLKDYVVFPTISTMEIYNRQGKEHRTVQVQGYALRSGAAGTGTRVYFGSDDPNGGRVVCIDLTGSQYQNASEVWTLHTSSGISSTPAIHQGLLYAADDSGAIYAVNANSAAPVWPVKHEGREANVFGTAAGIRADVKADEYGVYVAAMDSKLYCIGRTDGRIRWQYFAGQPLYQSPTATATTVYQFIEGTGVVAIDKTQGEAARKPKWISGNAVKFLAEDEKYSFLERNDHVIVAVDRKSGEPKFQSKRTDFVAFGTALKNNTIYAVTRKGEVRAIVANLKAGSFGEVVWIPVATDAVAMGR